MKMNELTNQVSDWLKGSGPDADIIISTRLRLARNIRGFVFLSYALAKQRIEIESFVHEKLKKVPFHDKLIYIQMKDLSLIDRQFLVERHLISQDHAKASSYRAVAVERKETLSIMVNEEDHLRLQVILAGFQLADGWKEINKIDTQMEKYIPYAFSPQFGYLTACPTNVGTALRISVMLHLPALAIARQIDKVLNALSRIKFAVRGFYGEGTQALGDFYQISNQVTLGKSEQEIINEMQNVIPEIIKFERNWREKLLDDNNKKLKDSIMRAYGILRHAETITSEETMKHLSLIRLGINMNVIKDTTLKKINELFIYTQPAHLQKISKRELAPSLRDIARAKYIKAHLN